MARNFIPPAVLEAAAALAPKSQEPPRPNHKPGTNGEYRGKKLLIADYLRHYGVGFTETDGKGGIKFLLDECPFNPDHKKPDCYVMQYPSGMQIFHCSHNGCAGQKWKDFRAAVGEPLRNHYDPAKADPKAHQEWQQQQSDPEKQKPRREIKIITCEELAQGNFTLDYHIPGVLAKGQPCIAAGGQKTLKTSILIDLVLSVSAGLPFLGEFFTRRCRTGMFSGESGMATIQETALRIAKSKRMPLANFGVIWSSDLPRFNEHSDLKQLENIIKAEGLGLVVLDPAYLCMSLADGASNLFAVGEKLQTLTELSQATGCTIILCHHTKKGRIDPFEPPELEDISWSGFPEWARQWLLFGRRGKYDPEVGGHHELWLNYGGSAGHSGLWALNIDEGTRETEGGRFWEVEVVRASSARADSAREAQEAKETKREMKRAANLDRDQDTIRDVLRSLGEAGETKRGIRELSGIGTTRFNEAFAQLFKAREIEQTTLTKGNGQSYEAYKISTGNTGDTQ